MTSFVDTCVQTAAGSASAVDRGTRHRPHAKKLIRVLQDKTRILITTHVHPDPDAMASALALCTLLSDRLPQAKVHMAIKGRVGGGMNAAFTELTSMHLAPWDDEKLKEYDAIILLDVQPGFAYSPLPPNVPVTAVIDHHRAPGRKPACDFLDIRTDVGATSSIIFSYFMEIEAEIDPGLAAALLFAIESDLAGAAGTPGELDNIALSTLTLLADTRKLYQMRYVDLPQSYFVAYARALSTAMVVENVVGSYVDQIESMEQPAVIADFLLRYEKVDISFVMAPLDGKLICSLRTSNPKISAGELMRRILRGIGEGGGHRSKAGGFIRLENGSAAEIERVRKTVRRRMARALHLDPKRATRLVPLAAQV